MKKLQIFLKKLLALLGLIAIVLALYLVFARPYQLHWGATEKQILQQMPGDELDPSPTFLATRSITIEGTAEEIWPWLLQMGYDRAGFYGYDIIENLGSQTGLRSAERILPEFQNFVVGDEVPISAVARMRFYAIEPDHYMIWAGEQSAAPGGFTWSLYPIDEGHTRLVSRIRWSHHWTDPSLLGLDLFTEFTDHLAVRKILQGVKGRVEGRVEPMAQGNFEFITFLFALLIFLGSIVLLLIYPLTWQRWLAGLAAGIAWLITWYAPVPLWVGLLMEILVLYFLFHLFRKLPRSRDSSIREQ